MVELRDGWTVGFATFGIPSGTPVMWCHGGPGIRLDPVHRDVEAAEAGLLLVGVDRPGYGLSTLPGRTIADWVTDAIAVADDLSIGKFVAVGDSTGLSVMERHEPSMAFVVYGTNRTAYFGFGGASPDCPSYARTTVIPVGTTFEGCEFVALPQGVDVAQVVMSLVYGG